MEQILFMNKRDEEQQMSRNIIVTMANGVHRQHERQCSILFSIPQGGALSLAKIALQDFGAVTSRAAWSTHYAEAREETSPLPSCVAGGSVAQGSCDRRAKDLQKAIEIKFCKLP
jgi:hypothetical protein